MTLPLLLSHVLALVAFMTALLVVGGALWLLDAAMRWWLG